MTDDDLEQAAASRTLQDAIRDSGAQQLDRHTFRTNEGTVVLASPADIARMKLSNRLQKNINRTKKWDLPAFLPGHEPKDET